MIDLDREERFSMDFESLNFSQCVFCKFKHAGAGTCDAFLMACRWKFCATSTTTASTSRGITAFDMSSRCLATISGIE